MAQKNPAVIHNPALIRWARETAGMSVSELADIIGQSVERVQNWETGADAPSLPMLRKLAEATRRPLAAFYLPEPPTANAVDSIAYRTVGSAKLPQSHKAILGQRKVYSLRETMWELSERMGEDIPPFPTLPADSSPTQWLEFWRENLQVREAQRTTREPREFFGALRARLDSLGVLVVQLSQVPTTVFRGFLLPAKILPAIGLNWGDAYSAKVVGDRSPPSILSMKGLGATRSVVRL